MNKRIKRHNECITAEYISSYISENDLKYSYKEAEIAEVQQISGHL